MIPADSLPRINQVAKLIVGLLALLWVLTRVFGVAL